MRMLRYRTTGWTHLPSAQWVREVGSKDKVLCDLVKTWRETYDARGKGVENLYLDTLRRLTALGAPPHLVNYLWWG